MVNRFGSAASKAPVGSGRPASVRSDAGRCVVMKSWIPRWSGLPCCFFFGGLGFVPLLRFCRWFISVYWFDGGADRLMKDPVPSSKFGLVFCPGAFVVISISSVNVRKSSHCWSDIF